MTEEQERKETLDRYLVARHKTAVDDCHEFVRLWVEHNRDREREQDPDATMQDVWTKTLRIRTMYGIECVKGWDSARVTWACGGHDEEGGIDRRPHRLYLENTNEFMRTVLPRNQSTEREFIGGGFIRHYLVTPEWCLEWAPQLVHRLWEERNVRL